MIYRNMENQNLTSLTNIGQNAMNQPKINDFKFTKVNIEQSDLTGQINKQIIFKNSIYSFNQLENQLFRTLNIVQKQTLQQPKNNHTVNNISEPSKLQVKVASQIERNAISYTLHRSKSQNANKMSNKRSHSGGKFKNLMAARFSNKITQSASSLQQESLIKQKNSYHRRLLSAHANRPSKIAKEGHIYNEENTFKQDSSIKKTIKKKVRIKTNSLVGLSSDIMLQKKYTQCLPLKSLKIQEEDNFLENAYRLRKEDIPAWYELSKKLNSAEQKKKIAASKQSQNTKQTKKTMYESYDFNGQLIPGANYISKVKKSNEQAPQIQFEIFDQNEVLNLEKYHQRQQRFARSVKQLKIIPFNQENPQASSFLGNFENIQWHQNIEYIKEQQQKNDEISQQKPKAQNAQKPISHFIKKQPGVIQQTNQQEQNEKIDHEKLIEQFQRLKSFSKSNQTSSSQNFTFGFSKYVKVKKFNQKLNKSKSYNYHTCQYFTTPESKDEPDDEDLLVMQHPQIKGMEKFRANKRLFKQVFNRSLKYIEPQNRHDIATIKLLKIQKQNQKIQRQRMNPNKMKNTRNSDTTLLKKSLQAPRPSLFKMYKQLENVNNKEMKKDQKSLQMLILQKGPFQQIKTENLIEQSQFLKTNKKRISLRKQYPRLLSDKMRFQSPHNINSSIFPNTNINNDLQKAFKKASKTNLSKHSIQENVRKTFL